MFDQAKQEIERLTKAVGGSRGIPQKKTDCLNRAKQEINRQGQIYTTEETAYAKQAKGMYEEGKVLAFTVLELTKKLEQAWDEKQWEELQAKADYVKEMLEEQSKEAGELTKHQAWRGNQPWTTAKAEDVLGKDGQTELFNLFKSHRDPMVTLLGSISTLRVKIQEFSKRCQDCAQTAKSYKGRHGVNAKLFEEEVKGLLKESIRIVKEEAEQCPRHEKELQVFIVLCNNKKTKLDEAKELKPAEQINSGKSIFLKNGKSTLKTHRIKIDNCKTRINRSATPQQLPLLNGALQEAENNVKKAEQLYESLKKLLEIHSKKLVEAKGRK